MHTIKITPHLLFEYQCTSGEFITLPNRIEKIYSVARIESKHFSPELECSTTEINFRGWKWIVAWATCIAPSGPILVKFYRYCIQRVTSFAKIKLGDLINKQHVFTFQTDRSISLAKVAQKNKFSAFGPWRLLYRPKLRRHSWRICFVLHKRKLKWFRLILWSQRNVKWVQYRIDRMVPLQDAETLHKFNSKDTHKPFRLLLLWKIDHSRYNNFLASRKKYHCFRPGSNWGPFAC